MEADKDRRGLNLNVDVVDVDDDCVLLPMDPTAAAGLGTWNAFTDARVHVNVNTSNVVPTVYLLLLLEEFIGQMEEFILANVFLTVSSTVGPS
jgi:hypothetical protein